MRPCDMGADALHPFLKERLALATTQRGNARCFAIVFVLELDRTAQPIEVKPGPRIHPAQHPLPAVDHAIQLFGGLTIQDARRHPPDRQKLPGTGQAGPAIFEPAPPGQFLGQRSRRVKVRKFVVYVHAAISESAASREPPPICRDRSGRETSRTPAGFQACWGLASRPKTPRRRAPRRSTRLRNGVDSVP